MISALLGRESTGVLHSYFFREQALVRTIRHDDFASQTSQLNISALGRPAGEKKRVPKTPWLNPESNRSLLCISFVLSHREQVRTITTSSFELSLTIMLKKYVSLWQKENK
jgi:hypothetical protein